MAGFPEGMPGTPEEVTATAAHADDMAGFPDGMLCKPEDVTTTADAADSVADTSDSVADTSDGVADTPDDGAGSQEDGQVDFGLPLSALQAGIKEEGQLKEDAATTTGRRAAPSSSAAAASPSSLSTTPGGDSVTETVVAAREAIVSTGRMAVEDEREKQLKMEKQLEMEKQLKMEEQLKMEKRLEMEEQLETEKQLEDELQKWIKEKKRRNRNMKREPLINFRSMTPPPRCSGSSRARSSSRECQPGDAQPDPVLQDVVNCLMSISNQMWRSEGSDKNGGWPWFNGTCKDYPAFWRRWSSYEECYHQLTPKRNLCDYFEKNV
jgi:hypothetical protein